MKNLLLSLTFLAIASPSWGLGVTAGQITTTKLAPASVTTSKLHSEALNDITKVGGFLKIGVGKTGPTAEVDIDSSGGTGLRIVRSAASAQYLTLENDGSAATIRTDGPLNLVATSVSISGDSIAVATTQSPASNAACTTGEMAWDATYIYICTASTVWKRVALTGAY